MGCSSLQNSGRSSLAILAICNLFRAFFYHSAFSSDNRHSCKDLVDPHYMNVRIFVLRTRLSCPRFDVSFHLVVRRAIERFSGARYKHRFYCITSVVCSRMRFLSAVDAIAKHHSAPSADSESSDVDVAVEDHYLWPSFTLPIPSSLLVVWHAHFSRHADRFSAHVAPLPGLPLSRGNPVLNSRSTSSVASRRHDDIAAMPRPSQRICSGETTQISAFSGALA